MNVYTQCAKRPNYIICRKQNKTKQNITNLFPLSMRAELEAAGGSSRLICSRFEVHDFQLRVPDVAVAVEDLPALRFLSLRRQRDV